MSCDGSSRNAKRMPGAVAAERLQEIRDDAGRDRVQEGQPDSARVGIDQRVDPLRSRVQSQRSRASRLQHDPPVRVQPQAAVLTLEQADPERVLDPAE